MIEATTSSIMVEPIGQCNLSCKYCYTKKSNKVLPEQDIRRFISNYLDVVNKPVEIFWIGAGEITLYEPLARLINYFNEQYPTIVSHYIQTNGINIDFINNVRRFNNIILGFSLDGFKNTNDANRGAGTFNKIVENIKRAAIIGVKINVHSIVTPDNIHHLREYQRFLKAISPDISITFAALYSDDPKMKKNIDTMKIMLNNEYRDIKARFGHDFMNRKDNKLYLSISCAGDIYDCCELENKIGDLNDSPNILIERLKTHNKCCDCKSYATCYAII